MTANIKVAVVDPVSFFEKSISSFSVQYHLDDQYILIIEVYQTREPRVKCANYYRSVCFYIFQTEMYLFEIRPTTMTLHLSLLATDA